MEKNILSIPGYRLCEYLLVLNPHEELRSKIMQVKKEFASAYECPMAPGTKPHITLVHFHQYEISEERINHRLKMIAAANPPFKVDLKNYGSFPSHTIYINIAAKQAIVSLIKKLRQAQAIMKIHNDNKVHFITEPHLTVARKLQPRQYEKAWTAYSQKHFTGRFIANSLLLLKRREGEKAYQVKDRLTLLNLPVETKQGELFG